MQHGFFARFQFAQVLQALGEGAQLAVVQPAGRFFAVTGDERHGRAVVQEVNGSGDLRGAGGEFGGEYLGDVHGVPSEWGWVVWKWGGLFVVFVVVGGVRPVVPAEVF